MENHLHWDARLGEPVLISARWYNMLIVIPKHLQQRLRQIEEDEGIPPNDFVCQALEVWTNTDSEMRKRFALNVMRWKLQSIRKQ